MVKLDRKLVENLDGVQKVKKIQPPITWNPRSKWQIIYKNERIHVKKELMPALLQMTGYHCAFCDYKLEPHNFDISIEHFYPKVRFPEKGYCWENLFPSCAGCTKEKGEAFDDDLLRPDDEGYSFNRFFFVTGEGHLKPLHDNKKANVTIDIYKLNRGGLVTQRRNWITGVIKSDNNEERPFRFLIQITSTSDEIINQFIQ